MKLMAAHPPTFLYHPNPIGTGSVVSSESRCRACGTARGLIYTGPVYAVESGGLRNNLCPWCIADGIAAEKFGAEFTDVGWGVPEDVPEHVRREIATRTPGFSGWQHEQWLYHCSDATAFLGCAGFAELSQHSDALDMVLHENDEFGWSALQSQTYVDGLTPDGESTAYLFRCRQCGCHLAYTDMS